MTSSKYRPTQKQHGSGLIMGRRTAVQAMGALGIGLWLSCGDDSAQDGDGDASTCIAIPAMTEGPFFVDERLERANLLADSEDPAVRGGLPLRLELDVYAVRGASCEPLVGAQVDVWQANTEGLYSDKAANAFQRTDTLGLNYLRGYQRVDERGRVTFDTIYPGWYGSRTIHIHIKVRTYSQSNDVTYEFTSQLYFDDAISDRVLAEAPYNTRGERPVRNTNDQVFNGTGPGAPPVPGVVGPPAGQTSPGLETMLKLTPLANEAGYRATFRLGLQLA
jgi:protocatechuate 3,4-dioxygenase beta subunit